MGRDETFRDKVDRTIADLTVRGVRHRLVAPPLWRLFWKMGFRPRPPLFLGFRELFWGLLFAWIVLVGGFNGFYFGALYGWRSGLVSFAVQAVVGFPMAAWGADWSRWEARKHDLPDWEDYDPPRATPVVRATPPRKATGALILAAATFGFLVAAVLWR